MLLHKREKRKGFNTMPAIKVYKNSGVMIPVEGTKIAKAYVCPWTEKLFSTKRGYVNHLKVLRTERMHKRAKYLRHRRKLEDLWNQPTFDAVIQWIHLNPEVFWENAKRMGWSTDAKRWDSIRDTFTLTIKYLELTYNDSVSNTHACPHNGVTNWGGRDTNKDGSPAPRGYPGFRGRIEYQISEGCPSSSSDALRSTRIHTGSGGGGGNNYYGYDVTFFLDDWPGIKNTLKEEMARHEKQNLLDTLSRKGTKDFRKTFVYGKKRW